MIIARILSPLHSLGPGERVCLWTQGCSKSCEGCISPELQGKRGTAVDEEQLAGLLTLVGDKNRCTGLTVSGGDPLEQAEALLRLLKAVRERFDDILVYTGFTLEQIREGVAGQAGIECLEYIDVLIDGRYVRALNFPSCVLRGSANQRIIFLKGGLRKTYEEYMKKGRILETFAHNDTTIITGIVDEVD